MEKAEYEGRLLEYEQEIREYDLISEVCVATGEPAQDSY